MIKSSVAPALFKTIHRRSNIRVAQQCIQVCQGGTGSSVTAGEYKREIPAASQRAVPPASLSSLHSPTQGPGLWTLPGPETEVQMETGLEGWRRKNAFDPQGAEGAALQ